MIGNILSPTHILLVLAVALLVLGPKRLPEVGRGLGAAIRDFKGSLSGADITDERRAPASLIEPGISPADPSEDTVRDKPGYRAGRRRHRGQPGAIGPSAGPVRTVRVTGSDDRRAASGEPRVRQRTRGMRGRLATVGKPASGGGAPRRELVAEPLRSTGARTLVRCAVGARR